MIHPTSLEPDEESQQYRSFRWWNKGGGSPREREQTREAQWLTCVLSRGDRTSNNHFTRDVVRADGTKAYVGYSVDSLTVGLVAVCRVKIAGETRDAVASLYPTAEEAHITCASVDAAAKVRDLNFKYLTEGKGATVTARFGPDGITNCDPNRAGEGADKVFQRIYNRAAVQRACVTRCAVPIQPSRTIFSTDENDIRLAHQPLPHSHRLAGRRTHDH